MGKPDFLGNWCLHRQPKKPLMSKKENELQLYMRTKGFEGKLWEKEMVKHRCAAQRSHMALQSYKILNNQRMLYFIQRSLIHKLFQKWFFQQKMALPVLGKLKFYIFAFVDLKLFQINTFLKFGLFSFCDNVLP